MEWNLWSFSYLLISNYQRVHFVFIFKTCFKKLHVFAKSVKNTDITGNSKYRHFQTFSNIFAKNGSNMLKFGQKTYFMMVFKIKIKNFEKNISRGFGWTKMAENSRFWRFFHILRAFLLLFFFKEVFLVSPNPWLASVWT